MDRRYGTTTSSSQLMRPSSISANNSFIPTAASATTTLSTSHLHNHHQQLQQQQGQNHHHHNSSSKLAQQLALQSQLQAQSHLHVQMQSSSNQSNGPTILNHQQHAHLQQQQQQQMNNAQNHYYQNLPAPIHRTLNSNHSNGSLPHHHVHQQQQPPQHHLSTRGSMPNNIGDHSSSSTAVQQLQQHSGSRSTGQLIPNNSNYSLAPAQYGNHVNNNNSGNYYGTTSVKSNANPQPPPPPPMVNNANHPLLLPSIQPVIQQIQQQHLSTQISQHLQQQNQPGLEPMSEGGLPTSLVESMRTLFDILDDMKQGKVRLSDIESRWENQSASSEVNGGGPVNGLKGNTGAEPLIKMGVLGYLKKVTPADGMLTFDRFCAGLRLALLTNNSNNNNNISQYNHQHNGQIDHSQYGVTTVNNNSAGPDHQLISNQQRQQQQQVYRNTTNLSLNNLQQNPVVHNKTVAMQLQTTMNGAPIHNGTMQRTSKIPGMSASRLPTMNNTSGIPTSPTNRFSNSQPIPNGGMYHQNNTAALKRNGQPVQGHGEQGTTVALIHQPPLPNPKPVGNHSKIKSTIEAIVGHHHNSADKPFGFGMNQYQQQNHSIGNKTKHNYSTKNGSLDNLKSDEPLNSSNKSGTMKDRPPSAPILDLDDHCGPGSGGNEAARNASIEFYSSTNNNNISNSRSSSNSNVRQVREKSGSNSKKKSGDSNSSSLSIGKRVVNFVTPRQRTLSMPQLQFNKLKPSKSINLEDVNGTTNSASSPSTSSATEETSNNTNSTAMSSIPTTTNAKPKLNYMHNHKSQLIPPSFILSSLTKQKSVDASIIVGASGNVGKESILDSTMASSESSNTTLMLPPPPPKPPRNNNLVSNSSVHSAQNSEPGLLNGNNSTCSSSTGSGGGLTPTKPEIRNVLQSWQKGITSTGSSTIEKKPLSISTSLGVISTNANLNSSVPVVAKTGSEDAQEVPNNASSATADPVKLRGDKKGNQRRRETPRRHTVQSGIDFTTLKRLKQLEQERDVLQQGVSYIESTTDWYSKQLESVDEKITLLTKGAPTSDYWSESHEERLNLLGCRISEVNSLLTALMDGSSRLPLHMNLQIPTHLNMKTITRLKEQNRQLTQEVSDCSHRVTQLETEKAMLIRQLFHQKTNIHNSDETVYM